MLLFSPVLEGSRFKGLGSEGLGSFLGYYCRVGFTWLTALSYLDISKTNYRKERSCGVSFEVMANH